MCALHPRLIWVTISGFGRNENYLGPCSDHPAFDIVSESMSEIMNLVGFANKPPSWTIYGMADVYSGTSNSVWHYASFVHAGTNG